MLDDRWVVEALWGLGNPWWMGLVTPDHYTIAPDGMLLACQVGYKHRVTLPDERGGLVSERWKIAACTSVSGRGDACPSLWASAGANSSLGELRTLCGRRQVSPVPVAMLPHHEGRQSTKICSIWEEWSPWSWPPSSLSQALLNGYATPATYAEELGLDATATDVSWMC